MKSDKEPWTLKERFGTFMNTPHEGHSFIEGFRAGLSEGSKFELMKKYEDESHYYSFGWSIGEIIDRILNNNPADTKMAIAQTLGILVKYIMVSGVSVSAFNVLTEIFKLM